MLADAATWLVAAVLLLPVRRHAALRAEADVPGIPATPATTATSTLTELREGWRLFRGTTWLWVVVAAFGLLNAIAAGAWLTLGPALAGETIGRQAWGWVLSAEAAGALLATLVLLRVGLPRPLLVGMLAVSLLGVPMVILGTDPSVGLLVVASFVAGIGMEVFGMGWNLAMQENVDDTSCPGPTPTTHWARTSPCRWASSSTARWATGSATPRGRLEWRRLRDRRPLRPAVPVGAHAAPGPARRHCRRLTGRRAPARRRCGGPSRCRGARRQVT